MMKPLLFALTFLIAPVFGEDEVIKPRVGSSFGEVFVAKVEFVEKGASYIEQNLIKQPWLAKVISVNGQTLDKPVVIEYSLEAGAAAKGKVYEFKAYEDIYQLGTPRGWEERVAQIDYHIRHRLNLRPVVMPKQGRK